jgi:hypothetical protein
MGVSLQLRADVIITSPTGGNNVSADKALNSTNGAGFVALGNLVITEAVASDFATGDNQTLILTGPEGWRFNPGVGSISFIANRDVTAASLAVTTSNITITFSTKADTKMDALTISGVQVQALDGANMPGAGYLRQLFENPGTAVIAGIELDFSTFSLLNQIAGTASPDCADSTIADRNGRNALHPAAPNRHSGSVWQPVQPGQHDHRDGLARRRYWHAAGKLGASGHFRLGRLHQSFA